VSELALGHHQRDAFVHHLDCMSVAELVQGARALLESGQAPRRLQLADEYARTFDRAPIHLVMCVVLEALAIVEGSGNNAHVVAATRRARTKGIRAGHSLPQARSVLPKLIARGRDAECERTAQEALLEVAETFSPRVEDSGDGIVYVDIAGMEPIDLVVCGSVAVNAQGVRVGKGGGFSDLELALLVTRVGQPAGDRAASGPQRREATAQSVSLDLKEDVRLREAGQAMSTETPEANAGRRRGADGGSGRRRQNDLPAVGRPADARGGVHREPDVADVRQRRASAVDPGPYAHVETVDPRPLTELALGGHGRLDGGARPLEDREELVGAGVDLAAARSRHRCPEDPSDVVQQVAIAIAQLTEKEGGGLDIGHQEGDEPGGERSSIGG